MKIRGLRIELGEIESVMSSFDGIGLTAVTDKRDETGRQYLVGYYTTEGTIDEKALRQHLSAKLLKYMVPNYFVHLAEMPMTPSGKIDRKNLPTSAFTPQAREYIAPKTEQEKTLCNVLSKLFNMESVGVTDDFFELGGDSLRAIEYTAKAHHAGVNFSLQNVFDYPTVESLCKYLQARPPKEAIYTAEQFRKYAPILQKNTWDPAFTPCCCEIGSVLLTGATGFLGAHILDALIKHGVRKIYCLVRGGKEMKKLLQATAKPVCHLYLFDQYEQISEELISQALLLLPEEHRARALRYRKKIDRDNCVITYLMLHYGLRECYGIKSFKMAYGEYGKPYLSDYPDVHFNISHCDAGCAVVVADCPVGVDIQDVRPFSWDMARKVCCEQELKELEENAEPDKLFSKIWAIKESYGKIVGVGALDKIKQTDTTPMDIDT